MLISNRISAMPALDEADNLADHFQPSVCAGTHTACAVKRLPEGDLAN